MELRGHPQLFVRIVRGEPTLLLLAFLAARRAKRGLMILMCLPLQAMTMSRTALSVLAGAIPSKLTPIDRIALSVPVESTFPTAAMFTTVEQNTTQQQIA